MSACGCTPIAPSGYTINPDCLKHGDRRRNATHFRCICPDYLNAFTYCPVAAENAERGIEGCLPRFIPKAPKKAPVEGEPVEAPKPKKPRRRA